MLYSKLTKITVLICLLLIFTFKLKGEIESHKTGDFTIKAEYDNTIGDEMLKRYKGGQDYAEESEGYKKLAKDPNLEYSWYVHVPKGYDETKAYGLFVFINSNDSGKSMKDRVKLMEKHNLIWIGGNGSGNERNDLLRFYLAIKGADLIKKNYNIDPHRIIISGTSGGGRCASVVAPVYPDLFPGGLYIIGCNFWENMTIPHKNGRYYPGFFQGFKPDMNLMKSHSYAMITGSKDFNQIGTKLVYENYKKLGLNALYIEVPGLGHHQPDYEWFDKAFTFLDVRIDKLSCEKLDKLFNQKDYGTLSRKCKAILHNTPTYQEQYKKAEKYTADLKTLASEKAKELVGRKPHDTKKMLEFLKQWGDIEEIQPVRDACNEIGEKYSDKLLAKADIPPQILKGYIGTFMGMPCTEPAKEKFNELGKEQLKKIRAEKYNELKLRQFVSFWQGYSCTEEVKAELDEKASKEFDKIISQPRLSSRSLNNFMKKWKGFDVEDKAMNEMQKIISKELDAISGIKKAFSKKSKLKIFINKYKGTKSAEKAQRMLDSL